MLDLMKQLRPFGVFALLGCGMFSSELFAVFIRPMASEGAVFGITQGIIAFFYSGWPLLVGTMIQNHVTRHRGRGRSLATISFLYVITVNVLADPALEFVRETEQGTSLTLQLIRVSLVVMMVAALYIQGFGAKALVAAEEGRPVRFFDYWGTFFLFFLTPFGVLFLQNRVRKVLSSSNGE